MPYAMNKSIFLLFLCFSIAVQTMSGDLKCSWAPSVIQVDGKSDEWTNAPSAFFEDKNAVIMACSDSAFVYVLFRTNDIKAVRAIKGGGLTLFFDTKAGKKKDFSLRFHSGPSMEQLKPRPEEMQMSRQMPPDMKEKPRFDSLNMPTMLVCNIQDWLIDKELSLDGSHGPMAAFDTSQGFYTYEFRIPLTEATPQYYGIGAKPGQKIAIGAVWGGNNDRDDSMKPHMEAGFGDFGGTGGGIEGGGMRERAGMGRAFPGENMKAKKQEVWIKAVLATNAASKPK
jgi:hypothetical protein